MALAKFRLRPFATVKAMEKFIQTDADIASIDRWFQDSSGQWWLAYFVA